MMEYFILMFMSLSSTHLPSSYRVEISMVDRGPQRDTEQVSA